MNLCMFQQVGWSARAKLSIYHQPFNIIKFNTLIMSGEVYKYEWKAIHDHRNLTIQVEKSNKNNII